MKIIFLVFLMIIILVGIYLNRVYAHFYDNIGEKNLRTPFTDEAISVFQVNQGDSQSYVILGDSLSAGVGVDTPVKSWAYLFASHYLGSATLYNLARPSATSQDVLEQQLPEVFDKKPDVITLQVGINDLHNFVNEEKFRNNITQIIQKLGPTGARLILVNIPYLGAPRKVPFPYSFLLEIKTQQYNRILQGLASSYNLEYIDIYTSTKNQFSKDDQLYSQDSFHPNQQGYQVWVNAMIERLK